MSLCFTTACAAQSAVAAVLLPYVQSQMQRTDAEACLVPAYCSSSIGSSGTDAWKRTPSRIRHLDAVGGAEALAAAPPTADPRADGPEAPGASVQADEDARGGVSLGEYPTERHIGATV